MADPAMPGDPTAGAADPMAGAADPMAGAADPMADAPGTEDQGTVLCTIMAGGDGSYTLIKGDEGGGSEAAPPGAGPEAGGGASQGQQFSSVGELLKGILDLVKEYETSASGAGSDQDNFAAGFSGGQAGGASSNPIGQKF